MITIAGLCCKTQKGKYLLKDINFNLDAKEMMVVTGTSGSGKTTLLNILLGIKCHHIFCDYFSIDGQQVLKMPDKDRRCLCGTTIGFIPQNPMLAFHPLQSIGEQMCQTITLKLDCSEKHAKNIAKLALTEVNLTDTERIFNALPSQLSGGMLQRITIAICFALKPKYVLADEPTVFLDKQNKESVMTLFYQLQKTSGILLVTHELRNLNTKDTKIMIIEKGHCVYSGTFEEGYNLYLMKKNMDNRKESQHRDILHHDFQWSNYKNN